MTARILIVDDEEQNRRLIREVLRPGGYSMAEAADGEEALRQVAAEKPDLILLDIRMPRRDGYSVCRALKADPATRLIPVIVLTSLDQLPDKLRAVEIGADEFLTKPFHAAELTTRVRSLLNLKKHTDELENAGIVLERLAHFLEVRDAYTGEHCRRLGDYSCRVAEALGMAEEDRRILRLGAVFHDLGKVGVPDRILHKPGPLTAEERAVMERHPMIGSDLCLPMRTLERVLPLIRHHHERLDGTGYPDRLRGNEISLAVRIVSVVDVFDALATRRPYKEAFPPERCFRILREETARGWWDADVVETLIRIVGE